MMNEIKSEFSSLSLFHALIVFICITIWEDGADKFKGNTELKLTLVLALPIFSSVASAIEHSYLRLFWNNKKHQFIKLFWWSDYKEKKS